MHALPRRTGRPLSFERDAAQWQAMLTMWRHGYETSSVANLTTAMGINAPSLYAAFGNKRRLFLEAIRLSARDPKNMERDCQCADSLRSRARPDDRRRKDLHRRGHTQGAACLPVRPRAVRRRLPTCRTPWPTCAEASKTAYGMRIERDIENNFLPPGSIQPRWLD